MTEPTQHGGWRQVDRMPQEPMVVEDFIALLNAKSERLKRQYGCEPRIDSQWNIFCYLDEWEREDALAALTSGPPAPEPT